MAASEKRKRRKNKKKNTAAKAVLSVLIVLLTLLAGYLAVRYILLPGREPEPDKGDVQFEDPLDDNADSDLTDDDQIDMLRELRASGDLYTVLKTWATTNTEHSLMHRKDVINFLIVGADASIGNSDVILLMSLCKNEKKIYLSSIMRDCYTYMVTPAGEAAAKINAAYANGGITSLVETVENDYKIRIDHYVSVNFESFVQIVDILGGVKVPLQCYEMNAINSLAWSDGEYDTLNEYGDEVLLTGKQALRYCRIRKCDVDGDISRTRRQRQFITSLINSAKGVSASEIPALVKTLQTYVKTDCSVSELVKYGTQALTGKWYNYEIDSISLPLEENRMDYSGRQWVWIVDYPAEAVALQTRIYGETNIELSEDRTTAMDVVRSGGFS